MTKILFLKNKDSEQFYAKTHKQAIDGLNEATTTENGLMSAEDKKKMEQIKSDSIRLFSASGVAFSLSIDEMGNLLVQKVEE